MKASDRAVDLVLAFQRAIVGFHETDDWKAELTIVTATRNALLDYIAKLETLAGEK